MSKRSPIAIEPLDDMWWCNGKQKIQKTDSCMFKVYYHIRFFYIKCLHLTGNLRSRTVDGQIIQTLDPAPPKFQSCFLPPRVETGGQNKSNPTAWHVTHTLFNFDIWGRGVSPIFSSRFEYLVHLRYHFPSHAILLSHIFTYTLKQKLPKHAGTKKGDARCNWSPCLAKYSTSHHRCVSALVLRSAPGLERSEANAWYKGGFGIHALICSTSTSWNHPPPQWRMVSNLNRSWMPWQLPSGKQGLFSFLSNICIQHSWCSSTQFGCPNKREFPHMWVTQHTIAARHCYLRQTLCR